jgi:hypothetical protein
VKLVMSELFENSTSSTCSNSAKCYGRMLLSLNGVWKVALLYRVFCEMGYSDSLYDALSVSMVV